MADVIYDVIIIGGGPAGLTAGLYAGRGLLTTLIIEKAQHGGQAVMTREIDNYPGAVADETGQSLTDKMMAQAVRFGARLVTDDITDVELEGEVKILKGSSSTYKARTVIIACGASPKLLGCEGEQEFTGSGVSYCATCDAAFFNGLEIFIVGGGDSAVQEALFIARFAKKVTFIQNLAQLTAAKSLQQKVLDNPKFNFIYNSVIERLSGDNEDGLLDTIVVKNTLTGEVSTFKADAGDGTFGLFVFIGLTAQTELFEGKLVMESGYIITDDNMCTNIPGVYAIGDCRAKPLRQIVTATSDGAIAAMHAEKYLTQ